MSSPAELATVRLLDLPVDLHALAEEHSDELQREFRLLAEQDRTGDCPDLPRRLVELVRALSADYSGFTGEQQARLDAAMAAGTPRLDLTFHVPPAAADAARVLGDLLDEADRFCREGKHLLTLETPKEIVAYRRWYLDQFIEQIEGGEPIPWPAAVRS
jgi:hypothetical protein